jgi:hypothetical protein
MPMKPNYRQERLTRERSRNAKRDEKLKRREEDAAKRKALREQDAQRGEPEKN